MREETKAERIIKYAIAAFFGYATGLIVAYLMQ